MPRNVIATSMTTVYQLRTRMMMIKFKYARYLFLAIVYPTIALIPYHTALRLLDP